MLPVCQSSSSSSSSSCIRPSNRPNFQENVLLHLHMSFQCLSVPLFFACLRPQLWSMVRIESSNASSFPIQSFFLIPGVWGQVLTVNSHSSMQFQNWANSNTGCLYFPKLVGKLCYRSRFASFLYLSYWIPPWFLRAKSLPAALE